MLNNLQQMEAPDLESPIFIGTVVSNADPLQIERVQVTIPGVLDQTDTTLLPWCGKERGGNMASTSSYGSFGLVPRVGDKVWVRFQQGNPLYPLYWCAPILNGQRPAQANTNYPNRYGWVDPAGNSFVVDVTPGQTTISLQHFTGTSLTINNDGSISSNAAHWTHTGTFTLAGNASISGNVSVIGALSATQMLSSNTGVQSGSLTVNSHHHGGVQNGSGNTQGPSN